MAKAMRFRIKTISLINNGVEDNGNDAKDYNITFCSLICIR